jgi:2',3'-cyclic-nucleotide 2'-phosphodiesterase (5'-nucleotidase family)
MDDHTDVVAVETVEDTIASEWFRTALTTEKFDAVVVLFHIDYLDPLVDTLLGGIRTIVGENVPVQFLTGHSHIRAYNEPDGFSSNLEAGFYANTLGYSSFDIPAKGARKMQFQHEFVDVNVATLEDFYANVGGASIHSSIETVEGIALDNEVDEVRTSMNLSHVLGCSPQHYNLSTPMDHDDSLYGLYMHQVIPSQLFSPSFNTSQVLVQSTGSLRYDLYKGKVIVDDIWTTSPFNDKFYLIADVSGTDLRAAVTSLNGGFTSDMGLGALKASRPRHDNRLRAPIVETLPTYVTSSDPADDILYDVLACEFDSTYIAAALGEITGTVPVVKPYGEQTATTVWFSWAAQGNLHGDC